jgi:hypothetical protein
VIIVGFTETRETWRIGGEAVTQVVTEYDVGVCQDCYPKVLETPKEELQTLMREKFKKRKNEYELEHLCVMCDKEVERNPEHQLTLTLTKNEKKVDE